MRMNKKTGKITYLLKMNYYVILYFVKLYFMLLYCAIF